MRWLPCVFLASKLVPLNCDPSNRMTLAREHWVSGGKNTFLECYQVYGSLNNHGWSSAKDTKKRKPQNISVSFHSLDNDYLSLSGMDLNPFHDSYKLFLGLSLWDLKQYVAFSFSNVLISFERSCEEGNSLPSWNGLPESIAFCQATRITQGMVYNPWHSPTSPPFCISFLLNLNW